MALVIESRVRVGFLDDFYSKLFPKVIRRVVFRKDLLSQYSNFEKDDEDGRFPFKPTFDNILLVNAIRIANDGFSLPEEEENMIEGHASLESISGEVVAIEKRGPSFGLSRKCYSFLVAVDTIYLDALENYDKDFYIARAWFLEDEMKSLLEGTGFTLKDLFEKNISGPLILEGSLLLRLTEWADLRISYRLTTNWLD